MSESFLGKIFELIDGTHHTPATPEGLNEKIKILIVEDESIIAETIRLMLNQLGYEVVGCFGRYEEVVDAIGTLQFDLALLDINLGQGGEGIELGVALNDLNIPFIYLTSYSDRDTINRVKVTRPAGYIVKPFTREDLYSSIEIAHAAVQKAREAGKHTHILVKNGTKIEKLDMNEILYVLSDNNYITIKTSSRSFLKRQSLEQFLDSLGNTDFVRVHRSWIVNIRKVKSIQSASLRIGDMEIPVSRKYKDEVMTLFSKNPVSE